MLITSVLSLETVMKFTLITQQREEDLQRQKDVQMLSSWVYTLILWITNIK